MKGDVVEGVTPLTVVRDAHITFEDLVKRVQKTREEHGELLQKYHEVWYNAPHTWQYTHFLDVGMMKCPNDLWMYQAIMTRLRPMTIIETGTYQGASALWFAYLMDMLGIDGGRIFTVDFEDHLKNSRVRHPRITFLAGNSVDPELVKAIQGEMPGGPLLICLDSDHSEEHVYRELELYAPLCKVGDWLVVEDTNIGWSDGKEHRITVGEWGRCRCTCGAEWHDGSSWAMNQVKCPQDLSNQGARGGLQRYLELHEGEFRQDVLSERYLLTMNPGGWLERVAGCNHG